MTLTFERATPADAEALVQAQVAAFHDDDRLYGVGIGGPPGYDSVESMLEKIEGDECYKIVYEGEVIGCIVLWKEGQGHYHLDVIAIHPAYHNRGIGTQAMHFIERAYPADKWTLHTPLYAVRNQHFYEKFGYVRMGIEEHPDITLIAYEKRIGV